MRQSKYNHTILQKRYREDEEVPAVAESQLTRPRNPKRRTPAEENLGLKRFKSECNGLENNLVPLPNQKPLLAPKVTGFPPVSMTPSLKHSDPRMLHPLYDDDIFNVKRSNSHEYDFIFDHNGQQPNHHGFFSLLDHTGGQHELQN